MKNNILSFLLGIFITISLAATTDSFMTVKPAKPVHTVIFSSRSMDDAEKTIKKYADQGYIVKEIGVASSDSSWWYSVLVVMEKY